MNYTEEQLAVAAVAKAILLNLISPEREIGDAYYGICWNAQRHPLNKYDEWSGDSLVCMYYIIEELSVGWEHHSGTRSYPVPDIAGNRWEGKNLELRIDLMKHIVSKIDKLLEETV